jgi:hypothetical protein
MLRTPQGVLQGSSSNSWFLGALAAVACKRELLLNLIVSDEFAQRGLYTIRFFKHGSWWPVVVDNRLPCMEQQQRLAFCSSGQAQVLVVVPSSCSRSLHAECSASAWHVSTGT